MNKKKKIGLLIFSLCCFLPQYKIFGQCELKNSAFVSGEKIEYDVYFNYGFLYIKAGKGFLTITDANHKGKSAYKTYMQVNSGGLAGNLYTVNDTLTSYVDMNLRPLLFTKEAFEGKDYSTEKQIYTYDGSSLKVRAIRTWNGEPDFDQTLTIENCAYDYLSILLYVRNLDFSKMKKGDKQYVHFLSGKQIVNMSINYEGTSSMKANDGNRYDVINLSMTILDKAFKNPQKAIRASLTNDNNRVPIVIETALKIGSVKAVMRSFSGKRN